MPNEISVNILEKENNTICVFEINESDYSPHQTGDKYYMRLDGQTRTAPHHYIEALFKKIKYPNLETVFKIVYAGVESGTYIRIDFRILFSNWSPMINEENFSFRIVTDLGIFKPYTFGETKNYRLDGHEYFKNSFKDVFYYGEPIVETETILIDPYKLQEKNHLFELFVYFGGKHSPLKFSQYTLNLREISSSNFQKLIVDKLENKLIIDSHQENGLDKESIINSFLAK